jgi:uncharacterized membrane protein YqjE
MDDPALNRQRPAGGSPQPHGALRRLVRAGGALLVARAEFASVELALARAQLMRWLLLALLALLLGLLGLLSLTALVTLLLWPVLGWGALLLPAIVYVSAGIWVVRRLMHEVATAPPLLHETLQELMRDRDALRRAMGRAADGSLDPGSPNDPNDPNNPNNPRPGDSA